MSVLPQSRLLAVATAAAALLLFGPLAAADAPAVAADSCSDDDRDQVVGAPLLSASRGAVDVQQVGRASQVLTRATLGAGPARAGDRLGAAIARDRAGNGCTLLAIGAPGVNGTGAVSLAVDAPGGFGAATVTIPGRSGGERFGETVLFSRTDDPNTLELWVGAPRRDIGAAADAGAIERYRISTTPGSAAVTVAHVQTLRQGTSTIPGTSAEANDRFGEVLAGAERGVAVGVPHENVGSAVDAGMVVMIGPAKGTYRALRTLTQNSPGIAGTAESHDRFGAAITECGHLIGIPGEDLGRDADAGMVQVLRGCDPTHLRPAGALSQDSPGVPGSTEPGDRFGSAVALAESPEDGTSAFIGVPGEDLGTRRDAGMVVGEYSCGVPPCGWRAYTQGDDLPGAPEAGDGLGSSLGIRHFYRPFDGGPVLHETSFPFMGAPGEDLGRVRDAGAAYGRVAVDGDVLLVTAAFSGGPTAGLRYGSVFATDTYGYPGA